MFVKNKLLMDPVLNQEFHMRLQTFVFYTHEEK